MSAPSGRFGTGVFWSGATAAAGVLLPFALFVYFARTVAPADIGLVAVAIALSEILKAVGLPGVYEALLQQCPVRRTAYETALAMLLCAGILLAAVYLLILFGLSHTIASFHGRFDLLASICLRIPLDLASIQPQAALAERLAYRRLALRTIIGNGLAGVVGVATAWFASPVVGLVCYQVLQSVLTCTVTMIGAGSVARPRLHRSELKALGPETGYATGNRLIAAAINSLDQLVLAAVAGTVFTAYYSVGKRLETTFVTVANSFTSVLFQPLFSRSSGADLARAVRRGLLTVLITCGLPAAVVATNGRLVVTFLFGHQWQGAAVVASLLAVSGLARGIGMVPGALLSVSGRNRELLTTSIVSAAGSLAIVAALGPISLAACAATLAFKNAALSLWLGVLTRQEAGSALRRYVLELLLPFAVLVAAITFVRMLVIGGTAIAPPHLISMLLPIVAAAVLAAAVLLSRRISTAPAGGPAIDMTGADR